MSVNSMRMPRGRVAPMNPMTVYPVPGRTVLMPEQGFKKVPAAGVAVDQLDTFYLRAVQDGDLTLTNPTPPPVVVPEPPPPTPPPAPTPAPAPIQSPPTTRQRTTPEPSSATL